jgi:hypothetical protein
MTKEDEATPSGDAHAAKSSEAPNKEKCEKCLLEWERDKPQTFENCPFKANKECPVSKAIALTSFS